MKTSRDPRHQARIRIMKDLFGWNFSDQNEVHEEKTHTILKKLDEIDKVLAAAAPSWPLDKINKIDLAILRLAIYELVFDKSAPEKVVVDEAVELAKEYGAESSPGFVNGALGKVVDMGPNVLVVDKKVI